MESTPAMRSMSPALVGAVAAAALAGLLFGFDTAVIAGVTGDISRVYGLTPATLGITVSSALWGTLLGAMASALLVDVRLKLGKDPKYYIVFGVLFLLIFAVEIAGFNRLFN